MSKFHDKEPVMIRHLGYTLIAALLVGTLLTACTSGSLDTVSEQSAEQSAVNAEATRERACEIAREEQRLALYRELRCGGSSGPSYSLPPCRTHEIRRIGLFTQTDFAFGVPKELPFAWNLDELTGEPRQFAADQLNDVIVMVEAPDDAGPANDGRVFESSGRNFIQYTSPSGFVTMRREVLPSSTVIRVAGQLIEKGLNEAFVINGGPQDSECELPVSNSSTHFCKRFYFKVDSIQTYSSANDAIAQIETINPRCGDDRNKQGADNILEAANNGSAANPDALGCPPPSQPPPPPPPVLITGVELRPGSEHGRVARVSFIEVPRVPDDADPPWDRQTDRPANFYKIRAIRTALGSDNALDTVAEWDEMCENKTDLNCVPRSHRKHVPGKRKNQCKGKRDRYGNCDWEPRERTITFRHLHPGFDFCFAARAVHMYDKRDRNNDGERYKISDFHPDNSGGFGETYCLGEPAAAPLPPCPIHLQAEAGADPQTQIKLFWEEDEDAFSDDCEKIDLANLDNIELKFRKGEEDYDDATWLAAADGDESGLWSVPVDASALLTPRSEANPDAGMLIDSLEADTTYMFAVRNHDSVKPSGSDWSDVSNHLPGTTEDEDKDPNPTGITGTGEFIDLAANMPTDESGLPLNTNMGHSIHIFPNVNGMGQPSILFADRSSGVGIYKIADSYNVAADRFADELPMNFANLTESWGDGQPDVLDRDRHSLRMGADDCDGVDTGQPDSFALCNLPGVSKYSNASGIAVGLLNGDAHPDLVVANFKGGSMANADPGLDGIFINTGQDLCAGRNDVIDGIPCFEAAVDLPPQTIAADEKFPSTRAILVDVDRNDGNGSADLIAMVSSGPSGNGVNLYLNGCKETLGACDASDFSVVTPEVVDFENDINGDPLTIGLAMPLHAADVAFPDLNGDGVADMVLARQNIHTTLDPLDPAYANFDGRNLVFQGEVIPDAVDPVNNPPTFRFALNESLLADAQQDDCNSSFISAEQIKDNAGVPQADYVLFGHTLNAAPKQPGGSCGTEIYFGSAGFAAAGGGTRALLLGDQYICHNGLVGDTRLTGFGDAVITCTVNGDPSGNGAVVFKYDNDDEDADGITDEYLLREGNNFYFQAYDEDSGNDIADFRPLTDACVDTNSDGMFDMSECFDVNGRPTGRPMKGYSYATFSYSPGACNAVGIGDVDGDTVPDLYFGSGAISIGSAAPDMLYTQIPLVP